MTRRSRRPCLGRALLRVHRVVGFRGARTSGEGGHRTAVSGRPIPASRHCQTSTRCASTRSGCAVFGCACDAPDQDSDAEREEQHGFEHSSCLPLSYAPSIEAKEKVPFPGLFIGAPRFELGTSSPFWSSRSI